MASGTVTATGTVALGDSSPEEASIKVIQLEKLGTFTLTLEGRKRHADLVTSWVAIPFYARYLNAAVAGDGIQPAGTAISDNSIIMVNASGLDLRLNVSAIGATGFTYETSDLVGSATGAGDVSVSGVVTVGRVKGTATRSSVATAVSATLLAANANRKAAFFYNNHATITAYISPTSPAVAATDIPIPAGASYVDDDTTGAWYVIPASSTSDMRVIEVA